MNRMHRVVWSESRKAFIVTSENAKAKGKPSSTRTAVASAVVMALAAMAASPALAADVCGAGLTTINTAQTPGDNCILGTGDSLTVIAPGSLSGANPAVGVFGGNAATSISNSGTISSNTIGIRLSDSSITGGISNSGTISGLWGGIVVGGTVPGSSVTGGIINSGMISGGFIGITLAKSSVDSISNDLGGTVTGVTTGIRLRSSSTVTGGISNSGTISGGSKGIYLSTSSTVTGGITNNAGGTVSGSSNGIALNSGSTVGSILNSGTISASNGHAIDIRGGSSITGNIENNGAAAAISATTGIYVSNGSIGGSIINSGTITSTSSNGTGIYLSSSSVTGDISNDVNSTISGGTSSSGAGIRISNSSTVTGGISNSGTISGVIGVSISSGSTVTGGITNNAGGTISGSSNGIALNSGSTVGSILNSGTISGGTYAIYVDGTSTLANIDITGTTAHLIGNVFAQNTALNIASGASFTSQGTFDVQDFNIANTGRFNMAHDVTVKPTTGLFNNAGTLAVAAGTISTITGNYTQAATGAFETGVSSNTVYGKLVVTGTADLSASNKLAVNVVGAPVLAAGTVLPGVITAGTLTAGPTYTVTDNSALFDFTGATNSNAIDLMIVAAAATGGPSVVGSVNFTGNTSAVGAATVFDALIAGGATGNADMDAVITALGALPTQQAVSNAASQTLPLMTGGMAQAAFARLHGVNRVVQARHEENRGMSSGDSFVGNRNAWVKPLGSWADQKDRNGAFGYGAQTYGMALGADSELSQISRVGAAFAYTHSAVDSNSGAQTAGVNSYQVVLYGSRSLDERTEFNWQVDYGHNQNNGNRNIAFVNRTAAADYTSSSIHLGAGVGRTLAMSPQTSFTPSFRADYTSIRDNGYTETGAGALNLVVNGKTTDEFLLAVDGKVAHAVSDTTTLMANLGVGYDTQAKQSSITAAFQGGGAAFTTMGINPSATLVRGGLGMVVKSSNAMEVTARYDIEARSGFTGQTASIKLRMPF